MLRWAQKGSGATPHVSAQRGPPCHPPAATWTPPATPKFHDTRSNDKLVSYLSVVDVTRGLVEIERGSGARTVHVERERWRGTSQPDRFSPLSMRTATPADRRPLHISVCRGNSSSSSSSSSRNNSTSKSSSVWGSDTTNIHTKAVTCRAVSSSS